MTHKQDEHPSWDPKWFGFIKVAYLAIPISNGLNSTHSWYRIADSFGFTTTAVNIGIGCLKSVKRFWNSDNLIGGSWPRFPSDIFRKSGQNFEPDLIETIFGYRPLIPAWFSYYVSPKELRQPYNQKCPQTIPVVRVYAFPINVLRNFLFVCKIKNSIIA